MQLAKSRWRSSIWCSNTVTIGFISEKMFIMNCNLIQTSKCNNNNNNNLINRVSASVAASCLVPTPEQFRDPHTAMGENIIRQSSCKESDIIFTTTTTTTSTNTTTSHQMQRRSYRNGPSNGVMKQPDKNKQRQKPSHPLSEEAFKIAVISVLEGHRRVLENSIISATLITTNPNQQPQEMLKQQRKQQESQQIPFGNISAVSPYLNHSFILDNIPTELRVLYIDRKKLGKPFSIFLDDLAASYEMNDFGDNPAGLSLFRTAGRDKIRVYFRNFIVKAGIEKKMTEGENQVQNKQEHQQAELLHSNSDKGSGVSRSSVKEEYATHNLKQQSTSRDIPSNIKSAPPPPTAPNNSHPSRTHLLSTHLKPNLNTDIDFCFLVSLQKAPPAPILEIHRTVESVKDSLGEAEKGVISMQNFVTSIPYFFIPVEDLLATLEGYTQEHVDMYFARSRGVQVVTVSGKMFIRLYGGYTKMNMTDSYVASDKFERYRPDPSAAAPFIEAFQNIRNAWMPLRILLEKAGPEAESKLCFQGPYSLLYFAQLQHIFAFACDNGGAVQLRDDQFNGLDLDTSPCPIPIQRIMDHLNDEMVDYKTYISEPDGFISCGEEQREHAPLTQEMRDDVLSFFPSFEAAIFKHRPVLYLESDLSLLMRAKVKDREDVKKLSLEQQLEIAVFKQDKRRVRQIRKKMAVQNNPDNPLLDKDTLAREIYNYIPKTGYITLVTLARRTLPVEFLDFMGKDHIRFIKNYPQLFQLYELDYASKWCVSRAGVQLPQGVLRSEYTEDECLRVVASTLQQKGKGQGMSCGGIALLVPQGVRDYIKKQYTSMFYFCTKYNEYFSILRRSETQNATASAMVSLLKMPLEMSSYSSNSSDNGESGRKNYDDKSEFD